MAQLIVDHVNQNYRRRRLEPGRWLIVEIDDATTRFIRLAALLHDVGHLPFGHTLEDELNHLRSHDGPERLNRVARIPYASHELDHALVPCSEKPEAGWTLKALIDRLYKRHAVRLSLTDVDAFTVLSHIVCKPPKNDGSEKAVWQRRQRA